MYLFLRRRVKKAVVSKNQKLIYCLIFNFNIDNKAKRLSNRVKFEEDRKDDEKKTVDRQRVKYIAFIIQIKNITL